MLRSLFGRKPKRRPVKKRDKRQLLAIDGENIAIHVRFHPRARRIVMRIHPVTGEVTLTAPARTSMAAALAFARGEAGWITDQRGAMPPPIVLEAGVDVPYLGLSHR